MDRNPQNFDPHENLITIPYSVNYYITIKTQTYLITGQQILS